MTEHNRRIVLASRPQGAVSSWPFRPGRSQGQPTCLGDTAALGRGRGGGRMADDVRSGSRIFSAKTSRRHAPPASIRGSNSGTVSQVSRRRHIEVEAR